MEKNILCKFTTEMKFDKFTFKEYYKLFLKKSWPLYIYILLFSILFIIFYFLWPNFFNLLCAILWPIVSTLFFVIIGGVYKVLRHKKGLENQLREFCVYSDFLEVSYTTNGNSYTDRYNYANLKKMTYIQNKEKLFFLWENGPFFILSKSDFTPEAFEFLCGFIK